MTSSAAKVPDTSSAPSATTAIQYLKGVGPYLSQLFEKKAVYTAWDLLFYLPLRYVDRRVIHSIKTLPVEKKQSFVAEVAHHHMITTRQKRKIFHINVTDGTGVAQLTFFRFNEAYLRKRYAVGRKLLIFGDVRLYRGVKTISHPEIELWEDEDNPQEQIYPLYSLTEGMHQKTVRRVFEKNLLGLLDVVEDDPRSVRESGDVQISLKDAFCFVHAPPQTAHIDELNARSSPFHKRIIYDEFFYLKLGLLSKRYRQAKKEAPVIESSGALAQKVRESLPFELTDHQEQAIEDVRQDLASGHPMNRLVQGDVGSGKTLVAFLSSLLAIEAGFQVALMAPTEILAEQHYKNLFPYEQTLGVRIELLTGSTKTKERKRILYDLESGLTKLIVGTHALLTEDVLFDRLGVAIIDEQHRFGVGQRAKLKNKSKASGASQMPHVLTMTATPIPRSLSMCLYGDMDLSIIRQMPKGRKPILTRVFREKQRPQLYKQVLKELKKGRQIYFVYPLVEESEKLDLKNATLMHKNLCQEFSDYRGGLLHGKMKPDEKEAVMARFKEGTFHFLVATTVVEVGVDVPNSTVMVIEHAERFGLSQLHQLRGRVGRGGEQSYCFLVAGYAQSDESRFRLKIMEDTNDGFVIAEEDLNLRGPGEFLGTRQSGLPDFRLAELVRDHHLLDVAKKRAEEILQEDPDLEMPKNQLLKQIMLKRWGQRLDLSLV